MHVSTISSQERKLISACEYNSITLNGANISMRIPFVTGRELISACEYHSLQERELISACEYHSSQEGC